MPRSSSWRNPGPRRYVDWDLAASTAASLGRAGPRISLREASAVVADLRRLAVEAGEHVRAYTGLVEGAAAPVRVVDRRDWAAANVEGLRQLATPLLSRVAPAPGALAGAVGAKLTGAQAGTLLAYLSGRVLGQYEVFSGEPGQLLLVAPNIVEAQRRLGAVPRDFQLWVCLHEVTHRVQFTAVNWLRSHFLSEVSAFFDAGGAPAEIADRVRQTLATVAEAVTDPAGRSSLLDLVQTPAQRVVLARISALMTLLEGHAEFVMDGVGPQVVPTVAAIREGFNRRRGEGNALERLVRRLLGVDAKLRQYAEGRLFVHDVVTQVGMDGFNLVWQSPDTLPRPEELADPRAWVRRVVPAGVAKE